MWMQRVLPAASVQGGVAATGAALTPNQWSERGPKWAPASGDAPQAGIVYGGDNISVFLCWLTTSCSLPFQWDC